MWPPVWKSPRNILWAAAIVEEAQQPEHPSGSRLTASRPSMARASRETSRAGTTWPATPPCCWTREWTWGRTSMIADQLAEQGKTPLFFVRDGTLHRHHCRGRHGEAHQPGCHRRAFRSWDSRWSCSPATTGAPPTPSAESWDSPRSLPRCCPTDKERQVAAPPGRRARRWLWWATASTTLPLWPGRMWVWPSGRAPTWPSNRRTLC